MNYDSNWEDPLSRFDVELSFTWIDWQSVDMLIGNPNFSLDHVMAAKE